MKPFYSLSDFPERKNAGKNYVAQCPKCGKKHLSISRATGLMHCFTAGCDFNGRLKDFWEERSYSSPYPGGVAPCRAVSKNRPVGDDFSTARPAVSEVPMIPADYKPVATEILDKIKPLTDDPDSADADQLAARRYLADQGISLKTAMQAHVGCLMHRCFGKDEDRKKSGGTLYHCIAYVNHVNGQPVNVKYRSCDPSGTDASAYTKYWYQDSPTTPCAPYNIDCINPLLVPEEVIARLVIVEGGKDALTVSEAGYPYVISVPNGAASDISKSFEAFAPWFVQVRDIIICGDTDLPGRTLTRHLMNYFGNRCLLTTLPGDCKDISDVLSVYGVDTVREIIASARPQHTADIVTVNERTDDILNVLRGEYDHGYEVGYGPLTDRVFHPTDLGGLVIVTGQPNSGKTDFLNDLTCRLMAKTGRYVCYLSFEVPDKNKHIALLIRLILGKVNTANYTREQLQPIVNFLDGHMVHLDLHEVPPTPANILARADLIRRTAPLKYLIVDPYLFMELDATGNNTETQSIKNMLTQMQAWGRANGIWVIIVAHPRKLAKLSGRNDLEEIDMYTISGSANWANLADFIFSISRISGQDRSFTRLDMLKVRDQDLCQTGSVLFVRQPCGRYDERESEEQVVAEVRGKVVAKDQTPWMELIG